MKTSATDPWNDGTNVSKICENGVNDEGFEDSFVSEILDSSRLSDSEQYLAKLYSRLRHIKGGNSKKDLVNSLSNVKEDCLARLITNGQSFATEEEILLAANPLVRHIAPHLQALTASELVHLLKADVLQNVTNEQNGHTDRDTSDEVDGVTIEPPPLIESPERENGSIKSAGANQEETQSISTNKTPNIEQ